MLYIIATPIGNSKDVTLRAIELFEKIDVLLCEDTRVTGNLLVKLDIKHKPKLVSFYDEVEEKKIKEVVEWLKNGLEVGLVSDAGTPLLSDPGWLLVRKCQELGLKYTALPGPCSVVNAAVLSGLPVGRWLYLGFLPKKSGERIRLLKKYVGVDDTKIVFESPRRIVRLIAEIKEVFGDKVEIRVVKEMTKKFESVEINEAGDYRGEAVIVFR